MGGLRHREGLDDPREVAELAGDVLASAGQHGHLRPGALEHDAGLLADAVGVGPGLLGDPDELCPRAPAALMGLSLQALGLGGGALTDQPSAALGVLEASLSPGGDSRLRLAGCCGIRSACSPACCSVRVAALWAEVSGLRLGAQPLRLRPSGTELLPGPVGCPGQRALDALSPGPCAPRQCPVGLPSLSQHLGLGLCNKLLDGLLAPLHVRVGLGQDLLGAHGGVLGKGVRCRPGLVAHPLRGPHRLVLGSSGRCPRLPGIRVSPLERLSGLLQRRLGDLLRLRPSLGQQVLGLLLQPPGALVLGRLRLCRQLRSAGHGAVVVRLRPRAQPARSVRRLAQVSFGLFAGLGHGLVARALGSGGDHRCLLCGVGEH